MKKTHETGPWLSHWVILAGTILWALVPAHAQAANWENYRLGEATVQAPANWKIESQRKNREIKLKSPDGEYTLLAFWWFPDEPLLGYADIVSEKNVRVDERPAKLIHHKYPAHQSLQLVFDEARADNTRFNITLEAETKDLSKGSRLFDEILRRLKYGADAAAKPKATGQPEREKPSVPNAAAVSQVYFDKQGEFALRLPAGWQRNNATREGSHHLTLVAPDKRSIILVVAFKPSGSRSVAGLMDDYENLYYGDFIEPESIEHDEQISVGALKGQLLDVIGRIYRVDGTTLAFAQGRSWFFKSRQSDHGYVIAYIHPLDVSAARKGELKKVVESFRIGDEASAMKAEASRPSAESIQSQQPVVPPTLVSPAAQRWTLYENARFGTLIEYPSAIFTPLPPPENDDGRSFRSIDGAARFIVFGQFNALEKTVEQMLSDDLTSSRYGQVTYRRKWADRYVLSGFRQGDVFYRKVIVPAGTDTLHAFEIDYPPEQKATYDAIAARMAKSLDATKDTSMAVALTNADDGQTVPAQQAESTNSSPDNTTQPTTGDLRSLLKAEFLALQESIR